MTTLGVAPGAKHEPATIDGATLALVRTPKVKLQTLNDVRTEMARIYRDVKAQRRDSSDGSRMIYMLAQVGKMIEVAELEKRLALLEGRQDGQ